jgi:tRNA threonylcarbamoyladenosine biosynthesis protein TsaE
VDLVLQTSSERETAEAGRVLGPLLEPNDVLALTGDLGAGKTALTKGVAEGLGIAEPVVSPTFNILLVHQGRLALYHFDLYRLEDEAQLEDVDFYGTLEAGGVTLVEWGDRFPRALPPDHLVVVMHVSGDDTREIRLQPQGPRSAELAAAWWALAGGDAS